jgi:hypothetical protein
MTTTSSKLRPHLTYQPDQQAVPAVTRVDDLIRLAQFIAENTDPAQRLELNGEDRLELAMALPNLPDDRAQELLIGMVTDLHSARLAQKLAEDGGLGWEETPAGDYYLAVAAAAREAVEADLKAGAR